MEYLGYSDQDIARAEELRAGDAFDLLAQADAAVAAAQPAPPVPVPA
jgi:hypothetical protein